MDYATKWPEAFPLKNTSTETLLDCLVEMTARLGIPEEVLSDNGSNFVSKTMHQFCQLTGIYQIKTSPYHPQTDGMVERFNATMKRLLKKLTQKSIKEWDKCLPFVLWAYRGTVHSTTGYSPFELLFGRTMKTPIDELAKYWKEKQGEKDIEVVEYLRDLGDKLEIVQGMATIKEKEAKLAHKKYHDDKAIERSFNVGDYVLVFQPRRLSKLQNEWRGPVVITKKLTEVTYQVDLGQGPKRFRTFHVNGMKAWHSPVPAVLLAVDGEMHDPVPDTTQDQINQPTQLQPHQRNELERLKTEFQEVINDVPGRTSMVEHTIETGDASPIRLPPYRLPYSSHEFLRNEIKILLEQNIIVPSKSPWAAPVVLVPKGDGTKRLCIDYRKLNLVTQADPYPIPRIEELIDGIGDAKWTTALDLTKGYWQVPMEKSSQEKTAFVTPWGKYELTTMPFGLVAAPSTFQRLMDQIFHDTHQYAVAYLDDIIVHSQTWDEHIYHLREVFTRLQQAGLKIKEKKCRFACNSCTYLGHVVGNGQVRPMEAKVKAVKEFKQPKTKKDVRAFLGLCGYYRRFITTFSTRATPLSNLTRKEMPKRVIWTEQLETSFQKLKDMLTNYPVLSTPIWGKEFILQTDASNSGIGYVLSQQDDMGDEHPIAYGSRKLLPRETKYSVIEREGLAIVEGVKHFRVYLEGVPFRIETDHNPLTQLSQLKDSHGRIARWILALQPYNYTMAYRPGRRNGNADGLSREHGSRLEEGEMSGIALLSLTSHP